MFPASWGLWVERKFRGFCKAVYMLCKSWAVCEGGKEFDHMQRKLGRRFSMELAVHCENVEHMFVRLHLHFDMVVHVLYRNVFHTQRKGLGPCQGPSYG